MEPLMRSARTPHSARRSRGVDRAFRGGTVLISLGLLVVLVGMVIVLAAGGRAAFAKFGLGFLIGRNWDPVHETFGALPYVFGTVVTSAIAIVLAVPIAVGLAIFLNESRTWIVHPLATFIDVLAAIPSVVYGLWALYVLGPVLQHHVEPALTNSVGKLPLVGRLFQGAGATSGGDFFTAGVIVAIMILPIITAVSREVVATVPRDLREAAKAVGATRYEMVRMAVLPYARSGIVGATMLGLGRALGETIAVSMVVGGGRSIGFGLFNAGSTIPSLIASQFLSAQNLGYHRSALLALAVVLVSIALLFAALSRLLVGRGSKLVGGVSTAEGAAEGPALQVTE